MKVYENPRIANWAITQAQNKLAERHPQRTGPLHASEIFQCFRKTYFQRTLGVPPLSPDTIMKFAVGQSLQEFFFGPEQDGIKAYGIVLSADKMMEGSVLEFKSTRMSYESTEKDSSGKAIRGGHKVTFDPATNKFTQEWIVRCRAYCAAHGVSKAHIVVFFVFQNQMSAWTLEFTDDELQEAVTDIERRRNAITEAGRIGVPPPVTTRVGAYECGSCPFLIDHCINDLHIENLEIE